MTVHVMPMSRLFSITPSPAGRGNVITRSIQCSIIT